MTTQTATVKREILRVHRHTSYPDGEHWLEIPITGWDDVQPHVNKILEFEGREYGWSCWNSDRMVSVFRSPPWPNASVKGACPSR